MGSGLTKLTRKNFLKYSSVYMTLRNSKVLALDWLSWKKLLPSMMEMFGQLGKKAKGHAFIFPWKKVR